MLTSSACTQRQLQSPAFREWVVRIKENPERLHRKDWEFAFIAEALRERGLLRPGRRGLGFAVGREPLVALFASLGCEILATDLDERRARGGGWVETGQHAGGLDDLNTRGLCPPELFRRRVRFRSVDMRRPPADLGRFDFVWSACALEHLGSLRAGMRFLLNMTRFLKPGGVAVHTTEYNVSSDRATLRRGQDVIFRRRDLRAVKRLLESCGHQVAPLDLDPGSGPADGYIDEPPYRHDPHLKLRIGRFVSTSCGLIVTAGDPSQSQRLWAWVRSFVA